MLVRCYEHGRFVRVHRPRQDRRAASREVARICGARGIGHLRATVSGNAPMAEQGRLTVMASGDAALYHRLESAFACWGPKRLYFGAAEEARVAKLAVNLMIGGTSGMLAEALTLAERGGIAWETIWDLVTQSAVASPIVQAKAQDLRRHDHAPTFTASQMRKDMRLILDAARELDVEAPLAAQFDAALQAAESGGGAAMDYAVVIELARQKAGLPSRVTL